MLESVVIFILMVFIQSLLVSYRIVRHHSRSWRTYQRSKDPVPLIFYLPVSTSAALLLKPHIMAALS
ncbi:MULTISPECIES: hypothetical protein [Aeromonas]|uniref:Uncharacterized protein n=1 Tax=Aeromonas allosaccharophila TaxID=656 RepID=A0AAX3NNI4_9GAMM|nr:hypothetical protein [Aeromonas allosaccharophila]WED75130.1 hypothetical protein PYU98_14385 [Aeromonas allosaccharophila]